MTAHPIPLFDTKAQYERMRDDIDARVHRALAHGGYILGAEVTEFEAALSRAGGDTHVVTVGNGTDAISIALMSAGIGAGDAVFVPSFTYIATAGAVVAVGAVPVFCDVDPDTFNLDAADVARKVAQLPGDLRARAVIPVDLFGQPADYPAIREVADAHDLLIVADAAQSMGAALDGVPVGNLAPLTATSFYPTKPLGGFGDGGAVFSQDADRAALMRSIRTHGGGEVDGVNSRLDTLQAAVLLAKLENLEEDRRARSAIAAHYKEALGRHVQLQHCPPEVTNAHAVYAIMSDQRDRLQAALTEAGIATRAYYATPIHLMPVMQRFSKGPGSLAVTERLSTRILAIPIFADLALTDAERVTDTVIQTLGTAPAEASHQA